MLSGALSLLSEEKDVLRPCLTLSCLWESYPCFTFHLNTIYLVLSLLVLLLSEIKINFFFLSYFCFPFIFGILHDPFLFSLILFFFRYFAFQPIILTSPFPFKSCAPTLLLVEDSNVMTKIILLFCPRAY